MNAHEELVDLWMHSPIRRIDGSYNLDVMARRTLDAGYRKPRVIETLEQLKALPEHVVIREHGGRIFERSEFLAINLAYDLTRPWFSCAAVTGLRTDTIHLPATVLYDPEAVSDGQP